MSAPSVQLAWRIETDRLELRCLAPADVPAMRAAVESSLEHLRPWMPWARELEPFEAQLALVDAWRAGFEAGRELVYGVFERAGGGFAGSVGLHPRAGPGGLELGYWVRADLTGRGYATEMARAATRVAFELLRLEYLELRCEPANRASAGVARKLGFTRDALLRRRYRWPDGARRDIELWSLFADEYLASPSAGAVLAAFDARGRRQL